MSDGTKSEDQYGALFYYKYTTIPDLNSLLNFYESNCTSLTLLGRVRLASLGVNVTLSSLESHIAAVKSNRFFEGTDFKLASSRHPLNDEVLTSLSVRIAKEFVTSSSHPLLNPPDLSNDGRHLSAVEFHSLIQTAGQLLDNESLANSKDPVLLDARNLYETRIGKFHTPTVERLDPASRQYSDLPSSIDNNAEQLRGKRVLMYCTGGILCEMASAYLRSKGAGFENVFQKSISLQPG